MLNLEKIGDLLASYKGEEAIAIGVSGGADSMALARILALWSKDTGAGAGVGVHVLSVDHGLRAEAAGEVAYVADVVAGWGGDGVVHQALRWEGEKPDSGVQEAARSARYDLMVEYCAAHGISYLFLAHHLDDQAETLLFRLAKGSGLNGLAGMAPEQERGGLTLVRPLLDVPKEDLVAFCAAEDVDFIEDPSNSDAAYARVRLREARAVLEEEGLTSKRLAVTARRLLRARLALDEIADERLVEVLSRKDTDRIVFHFEIWSKQPSEIALRLVVRAFEEFSPDADYLPRMEKIEDLCVDLMAGEAFRKRTLGGVIFSRDDKEGEIIMSREHKISA